MCWSICHSHTKILLSFGVCLIWQFYSATVLSSNLFPDEEFYKCILVKCYCTDISIMQKFDYFDIISALTSDVLICLSCILAGTVLRM